MPILFLTHLLLYVIVFVPIEKVILVEENEKIGEMENSKTLENLSSKIRLPNWRPGFFNPEFIMTLKKSKKGQSIFEYFILTTVIVAVVLFFANTDYFKNIKKKLVTDDGKGEFDQAVEQIVHQPDQEK